MRRLALAALLALAACGPQVAGHRRADAEMTSLVSFDLARMAGTWHELAAIGRESGARWRVSADPGGAVSVRIAAGPVHPARREGPGRFRLAGFDAPLWVLWADAYMRTVVIGTPSGRFAMVLDRAPGGSPDRLAAARAVLAWNGYDPGELS